MHSCECCEKALQTNEIGISLRLLGRDGRRFLCRECLAKEFHVDVEVVDRKIEQFKAQGCPLFI